MATSTIQSAIEPRRRLNWRSMTRRAARWIERVLATFGALVILCWLTLDVSVVASPSMEPTLQGTNVDNGDRVVTEKVSGWFRQPRRWEVITFVTSTGEQRMKRVAGLPGEHVQMIVRGQLLIDGKQVTPPPVVDSRYLRYGNLFDGKPVPCGDGYYVLGDYVKDSDDSRFNGPVRADRVMGRAWLIVWPWRRFGFVR